MSGVRARPELAGGELEALAKTRSLALEVGGGKILIANAPSLALGLDEAGAAYDASDPELQMLEQPALGPLLPLVGRSIRSSRR
jgi:hypothetical protein